MKIIDFDNIPTAKECHEESINNAEYKSIVTRIYNELILPAIKKGEFTVTANCQPYLTPRVKAVFKQKGFECYCPQKESGSGQGVIEDLYKLIISW